MTTPTTHVVLGGNGVAGRETLHALVRHGHEPTSVGRRSSTVPGVRSLTADLLDPEATQDAVRGAEVVYLTAGLPYVAAIWERQWPRIVDNVVSACRRHGARLVYLDNVYAYGRVDGPMAEGTPVAPTSRKGRVRAAALSVLDDAAEAGLSVTIARSADFYGPGAGTSVFMSFAIDAIAAGKRPTWLLDADQPHSLTYTPDLGEALAVLGSQTDAPSRTWHIPTAPALTGRACIELVAGEGASFTVMRRGTLRFGALFNASARETLEMAYQYEQPSILDSTAFEREFGLTPTPLREGLARSLQAARAASPDS